MKGVNQLARATLALGIALMAASTAQAATVDIYDGYDGSYSYVPLSTYFAGQGYTVNNVGNGFTSLAGANLAILAYPVSLGPSQLSAIDAYVNGGGRLIINSDGQGFEAGQSAVNAILTSLGSTIVNVDGAFDGGLHTASNIVANPFTTGITSVNYGYTSNLTGGTPLVYGVSGQVIISYQQIGLGDVFAIDDLNTAGGGTFIGQNPTLYCNFGSLSCAANGNTVPEPATWMLMLVGFGLAGTAMRQRASIRSQRVSIAFS